MAKKISLGPIWLKAFLNEGSPTFLNAAASARKAGYKAKNEDSFRVIGYENRKKYAPKIAKWLEDHGFSDTKLKMKVLQLMEAKETVFQKLKGAVLQSNLPEGHRAVATSGTVIQTKDGQAFGDGSSTTTNLAIAPIATTFCEMSWYKLSGTSFMRIVL